jgi:DNA mismatch repair protein MutS2
LNATTFRTLEFESIRSLVSSHAGSAPGRARLAALEPATDAPAVRAALEETSQARAVLSAIGRQPYHDLPDLSQVMPAVRVKGLYLEPRALLDVASFLDGGLEIARTVMAVDKAPRLARRASEVKDLTLLAAAIRRAVLPSGEVADDASPRLREVRHSLARLREKLQSVMDSFVRGKDADRLLQEKLVTTRNDRYVLLVRAEQRGALPGIIHGSSGSGASLFVEPMPAVDLNNDIVALGDDERREVIRILQELSGRIGESAEAIDAAIAILADLDALQARALLARDMDASCPEIVTSADLELVDARHPLLMPKISERLGIARRSETEPVPVSLRLGFGSPVLVVSGPNTGGKTVALKTVGLLSLMAQCGLHIPAASGSRLPAFRRIYADIGDEQSIAANLSTFSAHLAAIVEMTKDLAAPSLVLLDEVGAGTDPTEGGALGVAIVDYFKTCGAMVVATTHHGLMKAYAQSTAGVTCASFQYDPDTYAPTYRLSLGVPGRSLALEMAERLGLPASAVADARARREDKDAQAEALLETLETERAALARQRETIAEERRALERAQQAQQAAEANAELRRKAEHAAFQRELQRRSENAFRNAADAIQRAVTRVEASRKSAVAVGQRARTQALDEIRQAEAEALAPEGLGLPSEPESEAAEIVVGARVRVRELGVIGDVLARTDDEVEVAVAGKRLRVPASALAPLEAPARAPVSVVTVTAPGKAEGPSEINLVGLTVDEALPRVDKMLDDAILSERHEIRVIHGFGAGRLRQAVAGLLEGHPHVATFRLGGAREGGGGVTIVELKD